jgi:hypothetical protein
MATEVRGSIIKHFLDLLSKRNYDIPLTTQWLVRISFNENKDQLFSEFQKYTQVDKDKFYISNSVLNDLTHNDVQPAENDIGGLFYVQSVKLPDESFEIGSGGDDTFGFIGGMFANSRKSVTSRNLSIGFLETNLDFLDGMIRPWIITASYRGLLETKLKPSIKRDIEIVQITKNRQVRKIHKFEKCFPISVSAETLNYDGEKMITRDVVWHYNKYSYQLI